MPQSCHQSDCLNCQDLAASAVKVLLVWRNKRCCRKISVKRRFGDIQRKRYRFSVWRSRICIHPSALIKQLLNVNICNCQSAGKQFWFGKDRAVFGDEVMSGKDHILCRFTDSGISICISTGKRTRTRFDEYSAVFSFADDFITCRKIKNYYCSVTRKLFARRGTHPQIFTDLNAERQFRQLSPGKDDAFQMNRIFTVKLHIGT